MNDIGFRQYLEQDYRSAGGGKLTPRAVSDTISRCRRVENALRVDLDKVAAPKSVEQFLVSIEHNVLGRGATPNVARDCRSATRRYSYYLGAK